MPEQVIAKREDVLKACIVQVGETMDNECLT